MSPADRQLRVHSLASCGTCRRALTWLRERGIPFELVAIDSQPPAAADLQRAMELFGRGRLFNTSGQSYRALGAAVVKAMDDGALLQALAADGRLIKRPFLVTPAGPILTGFRQDEWEQALLNP